jgi:putative RecB family exonuclease
LGNCYQPMTCVTCLVILESRPLKIKRSIKYSKKNSYDSILSGGKALLSAYHRHLPKDLYTIVAIEEPFSITFDGLDVPIIGVMDLVEEDSAGTIIITENKTSAKAYSNSQIDKTCN